MGSFVHLASSVWVKLKGIIWSSFRPFLNLIGNLPAILLCDFVKFFDMKILGLPLGSLRVCTGMSFCLFCFAVAFTFLCLGPSALRQLVPLWGRAGRWALRGLPVACCHSTPDGYLPRVLLAVRSESCSDSGPPVGLTTSSLGEGCRDPAG